MKFVEEIIVNEFLPTYRSLLAEALRERGLTQLEIANKLGISQSAVSKYVHGDVSRRQEFVDDERVQNLIEQTAGGLVTGDMSRVQALVEAEVLIRQLETKGDKIATLHEEEVPELRQYEGDFRIHDPESDIRSRERVLSSVRRAIYQIENMDEFASLIPNVGSNIVECIADPATINDVVGVPGRIVDVNGRPQVPSDPEFGASGHVGRILLAARNAGNPHNAALNIRYSDKFIEKLIKSGYDICEFNSEYDDIDAHLRDVLEENQHCSVLYQTGGFGIEPIIYLLADSAPDTVDMAYELL
ncbi:MAG: thiamine-phosphate synthase family protein [Halobacteriaceae archaeon]